MAKTIKKAKKAVRRRTPRRTTKEARTKATLLASRTDKSPKKGDIAPNFNIRNDDGHETHLSDFLGRQVILYFYPKDDTPGCTCEAQAFRDGMDKIAKRGASVIGVSCDSTESHKAFKEKYGLNFHLLSDTARDVVRKYGVWKNGIQRTTFLIDEKGRIKKVFPNVNVEHHYQDVLKALG
ncbi:MAG TPA: peroxiredoxin [bacterium]|nr:peroxiredoxin [bacterium]